MTTAFLLGNETCGISGGCLVEVGYTMGKHISQWIPDSISQNLFNYIVFLLKNCDDSHGVLTGKDALNYILI